jgi:hypothetical protein
MNKKYLISLFTIMLVSLVFAISASAACTKIQSGKITDVTGVPIVSGFDKWGYNYQAHMFNGLYENFSRQEPVATSGDVNLVMKWSDDWLSSTDCSGDGKLDRGGDTNISKGWLTNHEEGDYESGGEMHHYTYFVKIVYDGGTACVAGDPSCIWGSYTVIEEVRDDPFGGAHGVDCSGLKNPAGLGFDRN